LRASSSLFFFSPLLMRQFSSNTTCPRDLDAVDPVGTQLHLAPSSSPRRLATGASESAA